MKPVCVPCQRFYRCKQNDFTFTEAMPTGDLEQRDALPGRAMPDRWKPYKVWNGDLWECPDCLSQIIVGVARMPLSEHYKPEFAQAHVRSKLQVNDC